MAPVFAKVFIALLIVSGCESPAKKETIKIEKTPIKNRTYIRKNHTYRSTSTIDNQSQKKPDFPKIGSLKGKTKDHILLFLGKPDFMRIDEPAQLWQYRHSSCCIDLFFYPRATGVLQVDFLQTRTIGSRPIANQACFINIIKTKARISNYR